MKIFSTAPDGNEMADMANARYFNLAIKQIEENAEWLKTANNDWFERVGNKIPAKYRDGIKANGDELFKQLEQYGH